jgi:hypothetical protein
MKCGWGKPGTDGKFSENRGQTGSSRVRKKAEVPWQDGHDENKNIRERSVCPRFLSPIFPDFCQQT